MEKDETILPVTDFKNKSEEFLRIINHPFKFSLFLLKNLPSAFFSGVRVVTVTVESCKVKVPYKWFSQNPFRSTYFACLGMAAEMSTGVLALAHVFKSTPKISMLVVHIEGSFFKRATGVTIFSCDDGIKIKSVIAECIYLKTAQTIKTLSTGKNQDGELIAQFYITWSFKSN